jgi:hypothetical protein
VSVALPVLLALTGSALAAVAVLAPRELPPPALPLSPLIVPADGARWPASIDETFAGAEGPTRAALATALGALATPWARTLLAQALAEESDPAVRAALTGAMSYQSEVT